MKPCHFIIVDGSDTIENAQAIQTDCVEWIKIIMEHPCLWCEGWCAEQLNKLQWECRNLANSYFVIFPTQ